MPDSSDKAAERWWARFLGGVRHPSQGVSHEDLSGNWFVAEHKYRLLEKYSAEFRKAVQQHTENVMREIANKTGRRGLICFTFHGSRGQNARRFLMIEVSSKDKDVVSLLERMLTEIKTMK